jgi:SWI/SNF-related matrix-associated actin-dependent regulator of chromatin subfamily A member 5
VQVFRLVTEHTVEEKIVERAQQKLKLDAMVVQSGRLKDKDSKLSREELLAAVRFGADKIFKSKDSSITDDDIDMIMDAGKRKTQELNEKLKTADKGDLLDFKLDGSSVQTFEGIDYSKNAFSHTKADAGILGIFDIGKRERKEANYNEQSFYQRQITALQGERKPKPKRTFKLPKCYRLPRVSPLCTLIHKLFILIF